MLSSFTLDSKHILLLLSNQIVQMCDKIHEFCSKVANVGMTDHATAAACLAWVMLQAHTCMSRYLKDKFKHNMAINRTFIHFLMQHMVDQPAMGLKSTAFEIKGDLSTVKDQIRKGLTMNSHNQLDSKLDAAICLNNLKTPGWGEKAT